MSDQLKTYLGEDFLTKKFDYSNPASFDSGYGSSRSDKDEGRSQRGGRSGNGKNIDDGRYRGSSDR